LSNLNKLGKEEGIWNRPTESGNRWQTGGNYGVDKNGIVQWNGELMTCPISRRVSLS
jgi:hypothetical protein